MTKNIADDSESLRSPKSCPVVVLWQLNSAQQVIRPRGWFRELLLVVENYDILHKALEHAEKRREERLD